MQIQGSTVLLTGATGGIGHAIARALNSQGAHLLLTGRRSKVLAGLASEIRAEVIAADLGDRAAVAELIAASADVDIVIANAGLPGSGPLLDFDQDDIDRCLEVNLRAPIALCRALAPGMVQRGRGHFTFISSLSGLAAAGGSSVYSATKFGLRGFAHGVRQDLHGTGVGVSVVLPGFISDAGMFAESGTTLPKGIRTSTPQDVATAVLKTIVKDKAEIVVAPPEMHASALLATIAPGVAAAISRRSPAGRIAEDMAVGQRAKR
ncbi:MAG: short-chain dehydrogenase/reductase [Pseudonocardiales bacterium]|jgi:short-subunit dehydrogenase|nr:short-chain dehydrogenase/reductase [Pseudonocardiales bacterium]